MYKMSPSVVQGILLLLMGDYTLAWACKQTLTDLLRHLEQSHMDYA